MASNKKLFPTLWFENESGDRWVPPPGVLVYDEQIPEAHPPPGYVYQWSRFPRELTTNVYLVSGEPKSNHIAVMHASWSYRLVLALVRPSLKERALQILRYGWPAKRVKDMEQAIIMVAEACEGCLNTLHHRYGTNDGYRKGSEAHKKARTMCELCDPGRMVRRQLERQE